MVANAEKEDHLIRLLYALLIDLWFGQCFNIKVDYSKDFVGQRFVENTFRLQLLTYYKNEETKLLFTNFQLVLLEGDIFY